MGYFSKTFKKMKGLSEKHFFRTHFKNVTNKEKRKLKVVKSLSSSQGLLDL